MVFIQNIAQSRFTLWSIKMTIHKPYCSLCSADRPGADAMQSRIKSVSGGQECYLHTHSHSKLALRETQEDEEQEWNGKVIMESAVSYEGWRREEENVDEVKSGR